MQLERNKAKTYDTQVNAKKSQIKVGSIIIGVLLIAIPVLIALFVSMPQLGQSVLAAKSEIVKGMVIGVSTLPVILFVAIKGGKTWYKKWWAWAAFSVTIIAVLVISLSGAPQGAELDMGMQGMYMDEGISMGKEMN